MRCGRARVVSVRRSTPAAKALPSAADAPNAPSIPGADYHRRVPETDLKTVDDVSEALAAHDYLADEGLATAIFLALRLERPLLLEGEAGVGKTEVAKVLARWTGGELVRLQCY